MVGLLISERLTGLPTRLKVSVAVTVRAATTPLRYVATLTAEMTTQSCTSYV